MSTAKKSTTKSAGKAAGAKATEKHAKAVAVSSVKKIAASQRRDTLNLRIQPAERNLIDRAALAAGKTRTDFILDAARKAAESEILDRAVMAVGAAAYEEFLRRLDAPALPDEQLRKTMQTPPPWAR